jgi:hypothetical protein
MEGIAKIMVDELPILGWHRSFNPRRGSKLTYNIV